MPTMQTMFQPMMDIERVDADPDGQRFRLKAMGGGAFARMLGFGSYATITVDETGFRLQKKKFGSDETTFVPRAKISSTVFMVMKPMEWLGIGMALLPIFGIGLIFLIAYLFAKKRIIVGVLSDGHTLESVKLKAKPANIEDVREGMQILEELLMGTAAAPPPSRSSENFEAPVAAVEEKVVTYCPHCEAKMSLPASGIGRRVRCLSCREVFTAEAG
jgi:hypothetical protein